MIVRDYQEKDMPLLLKWHEASGFQYQFPDFKQQNFIANKVIVEGELPVAAAAARITVEIYGFCDKDWGTPGTRLEALMLLQDAIAKELREQKIEDAHAWLPPEVSKSFGRRLMRKLGWKPLTWPCFMRWA